MDKTALTRSEFIALMVESQVKPLQLIKITEELFFNKEPMTSSEIEFTIERVKSMEKKTDEKSLESNPPKALYYTSACLKSLEVEVEKENLPSDLKEQRETVLKLMEVAVKKTKKAHRKRKLDRFPTPLTEPAEITSELEATKKYINDNKDNLKHVMRELTEQMDFIQLMSYTARALSKMKPFSASSFREMYLKIHDQIQENEWKKALNNSLTLFFDAYRNPKQRSWRKRECLLKTIERCVKKVKKQ